MKQQLLKFLIRLISFTIVLFFIQIQIVNNLLEEKNFFYSTYAIYLFHFFSTLFIYIILVLIHKHFNDKTGFAFMGASMVKMLAAILFLLPILLNNTGDVFANLLSFFIPYFLFLVLETIYAVKLINIQ